MSTYDDRRRGQGAARQGPNQEERPTRQRRGPLFPLEADDIAPSARRTPPAPLGELLADLDELMPMSPRRDESSARRPVAPPAPQARPVAQTERRPAAPPTSQTRPLPQTPQGGGRGEPARQQAAHQPARPALTQVPVAKQRLELRPSMLEELLEEQVPVIDEARTRYQTTGAHLARIELSEARPRLGGSYMAPAAPPALSLNSGVVLVVICLASLLVLFTMGSGSGANLSGWNPLERASEALGQNTNPLVAAVRSAGDYALKGSPSVTPQQIDRILESYGSPAVGSGQDWYNLGLKYGIDPAFAVAFFIHESSAGSNPNWAGIKPDGGTTHNVGNIICAGYATCYGRFRDYPSWADGIEDWYRLIDVEYIQGRGHQTVADVIPVYAPSFENDVQGYVNAVHRLIDEWRTAGVQ